MNKIAIGAVVMIALAGSAVGKTISDEDLGAAWPLTVSGGSVDCVKSVAAIFTHGKTTYALNGTAQSMGYPPIDPIWKDNPEIPGLKISIGPLIDAARAMC